MLTLDQKLQILNIAVQGLMALVTIVLAVIAIWGDRLKSAVGIKPKLVLSLSDPEGEKISIPNAIANLSITAYSYHLKVINKNRFVPATNTRIVINSISHGDASGNFEKYFLSGPMQLLWQHASLHPAYLVIGPPTICDLGVIRIGETFKLATFTDPPDFPGKLIAHQLMLLELQAVSDNADSDPIQITLFWNGEWSNNQGEMSQNLVIRQLVMPWPKQGSI